MISDMTSNSSWTDRFALDTNHGYLGNLPVAPKRYNPKVILNSDSSSMLRTLREELGRGIDHSSSPWPSFRHALWHCSSRNSSTFVRPGVKGHLVTSDYLGFNTPQAFEELLSLKDLLGIDVRIHNAESFHPKGYLF